MILRTHGDHSELLNVRFNECLADAGSPKEGRKGYQKVTAGHPRQIEEWIWYLKTNGDKFVALTTSSPTPNSTGFVHLMLATIGKYYYLFTITNLQSNQRKVKK